MMTDDPWGDEDLLVARALADEADAVELFEYPGDGHLFADASLDDHDPEAAALLTQRSLDFLEHVG
jgi:dienelactone hydrolase